ncbi:delta 1-pyrroline-5-carboxylate synthase [Diplonema papillatum]|nr:delta 1-pyrroline-5-carboxylate synthase [Diplonema papillatum]
MNVRKTFKDAKRVMIKVGSNVLTNEDGRLSIGRIGHIVEQIARLVSQEGKEVVLVSSGAVAVGRRRLDFQRRLSRSFLQVDKLEPITQRAAASAGQAAFMALYEQMFAQFDMMVGNVLLTHADLSSASHIKTFSNTIDELLKCSIIPVLNENDVTNQKLDNAPMWFQDNDSLSAKLATEFRAQLLLLLTDIDGVYTAPPGEKGGHLLDYHSPAIDTIRFGEKSSRGRGGMESKIRAAQLASQRGVDVVVASGFERNMIERLFNGEVLGTVFTEKWEMQALTPRQTAVKAKNCIVPLSKIVGDTRTKVLNKVAAALRENRNISAILTANEVDLKSAATDEQAAKLRLSVEKVEALADGCEMLAGQNDPIGNVIERRLIADGLILERKTSSVGVILAVCEAPEVFPQIVALALRTGNALIFYDIGGYGRHTFEALFDVVAGALGADWPGDAIQLVGDEVDLTRLVSQKEHLIDVIVPRGAPSLASKLQNMTNIPVLGTSEAVCHVYVDTKAELDKAIGVVLDSKLFRGGPGCHAHSPSTVSYNTLDTLLIHQDLAHDGRLLEIVRAMTDAKIKLFGGPRASSHLGLAPPSEAATSGDGEHATIEIVSDVTEATDHINKTGSGIADSIVTEDTAAADVFLSNVDSAVVLKNASTRFADGYRLGMGAETGVTTKRLYARGPVGIKGLLTSRYVVTSDSCHTAQQEQENKWRYVHSNLPEPVDKLQIEKPEKVEKEPKGKKDTPKAASA